MCKRERMSFFILLSSKQPEVCVRIEFRKRGSQTNICGIHLKLANRHSDRFNPFNDDCDKEESDVCVWYERPSSPKSPRENVYPYITNVQELRSCQIHIFLRFHRWICVCAQSDWHDLDSCHVAAKYLGRDEWTEYIPKDPPHAVDYVHKRWTRKRVASAMRRCVYTMCLHIAHNHTQCHSTTSVCCQYMLAVGTKKDMMRARWLFGFAACIYYVFEQIVFVIRS